jgi:1-acyl-sn-glycerol-3-phosphate acyltransferase
VKSELVPVPAAWFQNGFHRFLRSYLKRHFHIVAAERGGYQRVSQICRDSRVPVIVYSNHPCWWDPLIAHFINLRMLHPRQFYAPIDANALEKYQVFAKLGFFGVDMQSNRGGAAFLKATASIFERPNTALWLTPEGRFADARDHDAELMPGLAHLCSRLSEAIIVPLALEYVFWEERLPECLFRIGEIVSLADHPAQSKSQWSEMLSSRMRENQLALATLVMARSSDPFVNLLSGKAGASGVYDMARRLKSWLTFRRFEAAHSDKFQDASHE